MIDDLRRCMGCNEILDVDSNPRKKFCNDVHKAFYYQKRRNDEVNAMSPEDFNKTELAKPLKDRILNAEKAELIPFRKGVKQEILKLFDSMEEEEIRRIECKNAAEVQSIRDILMNRRPDKKPLVLGRTVEGKFYCYIQKRRKRLEVKE